MHPHSSSHLQVLLGALVAGAKNLSKYCSSHFGYWGRCGHLVHKFVEGHPHCARPICKFYRGRWSLGTKIRRRTSTLCSSHFQLLPRALVTWYKNLSKYIHTARPISKFYRGRWSLDEEECCSISISMRTFAHASSTKRSSGKVRIAAGLVNNLNNGVPVRTCECWRGVPTTCAGLRRLTTLCQFAVCASLARTLAASVPFGSFRPGSFPSA
ncbi:hypothetical protein J6590_091968 [Homalodisca vitripennis]|nr:hypothetical protein J6590_091968 [Homalodisca vitripennis]